MDELARRLALGPATFPHSLDAARELLLLVALSEEEIRHASFLDQRALTPGMWGAWVGIDAVAAHVPPDARDDAQWIFHIGHVGSTLISRLLGELPSVLALREPLLLRGLAALVAGETAVDAPWPPARVAERLPLSRRLLARTFRPDQRALIKATSFTSEIAPLLVQPGSRALFLTVSPERYLATILAGETSRRELAAATGPRLLRLSRRRPDLPYRLWSLGEGERIALGWATEMLSLQEAADALPAGSVLWMDFDTFLRQPRESLLVIGAHLEVAMDPAAADRLIAGPLMQRYSKALDHAYSPALRRERLAAAGREHAQAMREGLDWLAREASGWPALARVLAAHGDARGL